MPIYEFYCTDCNTIFSFFSKRVDTTTQPACPRCGRRKLPRQVSRFATAGKGKSPESAEGDDLPPGFDEAKMEGLMENMAHEAEGIDENNPRQMAQMLRKLHDATGMPLGDQAQEAIRRMEAGESPEKIEEEMGDIFGDEEPEMDHLFGGSRRKARRRRPKVDETLYDL
jgi:putative FmdB family regulatory protein